MDQTQPSIPAARPRSAVSTGVGLVGLLGLLLWTATARAIGAGGPQAALVALAACAVPMILWSVLVDKVHRNVTTGIDWDSPPRPLKDVIDTSMVKIVGLWGVWGAIACFYAVGRWYWKEPYVWSMELFTYAALPLALLSVPYVLWIDRRLKEPRDGAWHFGQWLIGRAGEADGSEIDRKQVYDFLRGWAIKGFFLAFMIAIVPGNWANAIAPTSDWIVADPVNLAQWLITFMFMIDVTMAALGYALTFKVLDAHIRSANPYASGWMAALICYPPFIMMGPGGPLDYHPGGADWTQWLANWPTLAAVIGFVLVLLTGLYAWATVAFGIRFSNLTHRGIMTHGPYAFSKHPAYLSKNLFWWLASLPFFVTTGSMADAARNTIILAAVSGVYYWRARTEERHLSADPIYRDYTAWMKARGAVPRFLRGLIGGAPAEPAANPVATPAE